jgi:hypothetical protein
VLILMVLVTHLVTHPRRGGRNCGIAKAWPVHPRTFNIDPRLRTFFQQLISRHDGNSQPRCLS